MFTAESRDSEGRPQRDPGSAGYSAAIESAASNLFAPQALAFSRRAWTEASPRRVFADRRLIVIADGVAWIWSVVRKQMPPAIKILDLFHAKQRLWDVTKPLHADDRELLQAWAETHCEILDRGCWKQLMQSLGREAASCEQARQCQECFRERIPRLRASPSLRAVSAYSNRRPIRTYTRYTRARPALVNCVQPPGLFRTSNATVVSYAIL